MPLIPLILPMLPGIIKGVERIFGAKKGKQKKQAALGMLAELVKTARQDGLLEDNSGNAADLASLLESVLGLMKDEGTLEEAGKTVEGGQKIRIVGQLNYTS